jgi:hypothetical protein
MQRLPLIKSALAGLIIASCGHKTPDPVPPQDHASMDARFHELKASLLANNLENGWITTRLADGTADNLGDSLLYSGMAIGLLDCAEGQVIFDAIRASQDLRGGYFVRFEPLVGYKGNEVSRDGLTGLVFGFIRRAAACPGDRTDIAARWRRYRDLIHNDLYLYPGDLNAIVNPAFSAYMEVADKALLGAPGPVPAKTLAWELTATNGAQDIVDRHKACYPIHLSTMQAYVFGSLVSDSFRKEFCHITEGTGLVLTQAYCGAASSTVELWLEQFQANQLGYQHQRCVWESDVLSGGTKAPSLDWLILYTLTTEGV